MVAVGLKMAVQELFGRPDERSKSIFKLNLGAQVRLEGQKSQKVELSCHFGPNMS